MMPHAPHTRLFFGTLAATLLGLILALAGPAAAAGTLTLGARGAPEAQAPPATLATSLFRLPEGGLLVVLTIDQRPGWQAYSAYPADAGQPARALLTLSPGGAAAPALFPEGMAKPDSFEPEKKALVYEGSFRVYAPLPASAGPGDRLTGSIRLFMCSAASCWPLGLPVDLALDKAASAPLADGQDFWPDFRAALARGPVAPTAPDAATAPPALASPDATIALGAPAAPLAQVAPTPGLATVGDGGGAGLATTDPASAVPVGGGSGWQGVFEPRFASPSLEVTGLLKAALLAVLAGFILNFMPCVLPVVSLKLGSLLAACAASGASNRHKLLREHNLFFALGVWAYFLALAVVLGLADMAWGQVFQSQGVALAVTVILFALSLSLFGVFHLPVIDFKIAGGAGQGSRKGAFLSGMLATLLATPCSGPFLGGVLAWTLMQSVAVVMVVFSCVGLGMSAPYLVLAAWPRTARFLPAPGAWMQTLEKIMGFLLAGSCLYFLSILPVDKHLPTLFALWVTAVAAFIWGRFTSLSQSSVNRYSIRLAAVALAVWATVFAASDPPKPVLSWERFDNAAFADALGREALFVEFTADWCPNCKALEKTVLTPENVLALKELYGFRPIRVDLTSQDATAMSLLRALGSQSIPLTALFPRGDESFAPVVLRDIYTKGQLKEALGQAFGPGDAKR